MAKEPKELEKVLGLHELSPIALSVSSGTLSSIDGSSLPDKSIASSSTSSLATSKNPDQHPTKSWHIQPTCAITGEGKKTVLLLLALSDLLINENRASAFQNHNLLSVSKTTQLYLFISGLHEGLDHLYDMIIRKRKMQKQKKKR